MTLTGIRFAKFATHTPKGGQGRYCQVRQSWAQDSSGWTLAKPRLVKFNFYSAKIRPKFDTHWSNSTFVCPRFVFWSSYLHGLWPQYMYHVLLGSCSLAVEAGGSGGAKPHMEAGRLGGRRLVAQLAFLLLGNFQHIFIALPPRRVSIYFFRVFVRNHI